MADMTGTGVNSEGKKIWSVNGLVYTLGGLVAREKPPCPFCQ